MAEFAYNNAKNTSSSHTLFKLNYSYLSQMFYKQDVNSTSSSKNTFIMSKNFRNGL